MKTAKPPVSRHQDAAAELEALFAAMSDVILVLDVTGRYVKIAPTNAALLYRPAPELLGRTLHDVFEPALAEEYLQQIRSALERRETVYY